MEAALNIVLLNIPFEIYELAQLSCINKSIRKNVDEYLTHYRENYKTILKQGICREYYLLNKSIECINCKVKTQRFDPFTNNILCKYCCLNQYITLTNARKIYKLKDEDLEYLDYIQTYIPSYKRYCKLYYKKDIISMCYIRYGIFNPENIPKKIKKSEFTASEKRLQQLDKIYKKIF